MTPPRDRVGGVFAPITTPFDPATGDYAPAKHRANVTRLLAAGLAGLVVSGSTGEAPLLDPDEEIGRASCRERV